MHIYLLFSLKGIYMHIYLLLNNATSSNSLKMYPDRLKKKEKKKRIVANKYAKIPLPGLTSHILSS